MNGKDDIERIHKIDDVYVSSPIDLDSDLASKKVKGENKGVAYYAVDKDSRLERIFDTVLDIIAGKNKAGKGLGKVKDAVTWIMPALMPIDKITDEIGDFIKSKRTKNTIMKYKKKPWYKSKTINSIIAVLALLAVQVFDIDIVAADLQATIVAVGTAVASVVALYGRIVADKEIGKSI